MLFRVNALTSLGILGLNARNLYCIQRVNRREFFPRVDDKLKTKKLAQAAGVAVPDLYGVIEMQRQIRDFAEIVAEKRGFAIKPAQGSGGDGVLIFTGQFRGGYRKADGRLVSREDVAYHLSRILSGVFSIGGHPDKALIEYLVQFDPVFEGISYLGVPDVRIVVYLGYPIAAMVRLPTRESDGKANLHKGAIGAGIDLASGRTTGAVWKNKRIEEHPDTGNSIVGVEIPHWQRLMRLAANCYELSGLGYQGVDIVLDRDYGPLLLELNARPGLNVQIATGKGLRAQLEKVDSESKQQHTPAKRALLAGQWFSSL